MPDSAGVVGAVAVGTWCGRDVVRSVVGAGFIVWSGRGAFGRGR